MCDDTFLWWNLVKVNGTIILEGGEEERAQKRGIHPSSHVVRVRVALLAAKCPVALPTSWFSVLKFLKALFVCVCCLSFSQRCYAAFLLLIRETTDSQWSRPQAERPDKLSWVSNSGTGCTRELLNYQNNNMNGTELEIDVVPLENYSLYEIYSSIIFPVL